MTLTLLFDMTLQLSQPLVALDIESTGTDVINDRIVELSLIKIKPDGTRIKATSRMNPTIPISAGAFEAHGISDDDVKDCKTFADFALKLIKFIEGCDTLTYNGLRFDLPMLFNEFERCGIYYDYAAVNHIDAGNIFKINEARTLTAAVKFYCDRDHEGAHGAEADTEATIDVLFGQIDKYTEMPKDVADLAKYSNYDRPILDLSGKFTLNDAGVIILTFGKHKDRPAHEHVDFLEWICYKANFPQDTVKIATEIINAHYTKLS
jgi:DNA polymerase-3 subunit epsilon